VSSSFGVGSRSRVRGSPDRIFSDAVSTVKSEIAAAETRASAGSPPLPSTADATASSISAALSARRTSA
jgi:hypothetical protein